MNLLNKNTVKVGNIRIPSRVRTAPISENGISESLYRSPKKSVHIQLHSAIGGHSRHAQEPSLGIRLNESSRYIYRIPEMKNTIIKKATLRKFLI